jgi:hypothetical protein
MKNTLIPERIGRLSGLRCIFSFLLATSLAALCAHLNSVAAAADDAKTWQAGIARVVITPERPMWLAGYGGRNRPAEGKEHDLWVKVLALEDASGRRAVLITSDLLGYSRVMLESIRAALKERCGLDPAQVMLTASHTHSGPVVRESLLDYYPLDVAQMALVETYSQKLEHQIVEAVSAALKDLQPATLEARHGTATFAVNRRANREPEVGDRLARGELLAGPVDHDVPVLTVRNPAGALRAIVFGYPCHNTTLDWYRWCGDYAGFAQEKLEAAHPGVTAMFYTGCGADQNPLPRRTVELCRKYGELLAAGVEAALVGSSRELAPKLKTALSEIPLKFERNSTQEEIDRYATADGIRGRWARRLLARQKAGEKFSQSVPYTVQVWRLGDQLWISLAGEVVVDYALRFKRDYGDQTWATAYAHDLLAYIPSRRVWDEGGYEGGSLYEYGLPAERWAGDVEDRIARAVESLVQQTSE